MNLRGDNVSVHMMRRQARMTALCFKIPIKAQGVWLAKNLPLDTSYGEDTIACLQSHLYYNISIITDFKFNASFLCCSLPLFIASRAIVVMFHRREQLSFIKLEIGVHNTTFALTNLTARNRNSKCQAKHQSEQTFPSHEIVQQH